MRLLPVCASATARPACSPLCCRLCGSPVSYIAIRTRRKRPSVISNKPPYIRTRHNTSELPLSSNKLVRTGQKPFLCSVYLLIGRALVLYKTGLNKSVAFVVGQLTSCLAVKIDGLLAYGAWDEPIDIWKANWCETPQKGAIENSAAHQLPSNGFLFRNNGVLP